MMQLSGIAGPVPPLWRIPLFAHGLEEALPARLRQRSTQPRAHVTSDVTAAEGSLVLGIRRFLGIGRSRGETRGHEPVHPLPPADVLDRLPDDRQRQRRRGHRAGGLPAGRQGRQRQRRMPRSSRPRRTWPPSPPGWPSTTCARPASAASRTSAPGCPSRCSPAPGGSSGRSRSGRTRRDLRLPVDGVPGAAGEPGPGRTCRLPAPRGVRLRLQRDRRHHRQDRGRVPADLRQGPPPHRRGTAAVRDVPRRGRRAHRPVPGRGGRRRHQQPARAAGSGRGVLRRQRRQGRDDVHRPGDRPRPGGAR